MVVTTQGGAALRAAHPGDLEPVLALLEAARLPGEGVAECFERFVVAEHEGRIVAAAGLEVHGADGLLRSLVVDSAWRGRGLGAALTEALLERARSERLGAVYLLTDTAEGYFPRHGFERIAREAASEEVRRSVEFTTLCPSSSVVMVKRLSGGRV